MDYTFDIRYFLAGMLTGWIIIKIGQCLVNRKKKVD